MRVSHWCVLGVTSLLLLCEVAISQLCKSLITMVDGFHTLFVLMYLVLPQSASIARPPFSSPDSSSSLPTLSSNPCAESPTKTQSGTQTVVGRSTTSDETNHEASSPVRSQKPVTPATNCRLSFTNSRIQVVGVFISALLLVSLSISYFMEIISFILAPHPVQRPLLPVVVGTASLLHKVAVFWLNRNQVQDVRRAQTEFHLEVNQKVLAEEDSQGRDKSEDVVQSNIQSAVLDSVHSGGLVLCNPGTPNIPDSDCKTLQQLPKAACEEDINSLVLKYHQNTSKSASVCESLPAPHSPWPVCLLPSAFVIQGLFTAFLALINSLVTLLIIPQFLHDSGARSVLVYLDPGLSLLAVITLIATTVPQVCRYGLILLQASPPHVCVSDLGRRIASVPGVQAVHDLHIWQLNETLTVASVHVHCYAGYQVHRCADLMSGATKVLQSVGVSCCTVQPEFASFSGSSPGSSGDPSPLIHRDDPSPPLCPACSLACGKACARSMCCSLLEEEARSVLTPPSGETKEEPHVLVIENTFL
ncbi:uncharacterized protein LOC133442373 [Cololabis saira]|uniref:uncharacterized protein LOC133442373 n=1 Tax=Cololabis saira TaxID=129043 RepID=UPI002AD50AC7|nr:uncharacterized protein LOC133442373 [Cololabis saira]